MVTARGENIAKALRDGPRLRRDYNIWVEARDPAGHVLLGGLGAMGVGTMWMSEQEEYHRTLPGYSEAPIQVRRCAAWAPDGRLRTCVRPFEHEGPHHVPAVSIPEIEWS